MERISTTPTQEKENSLINAAGATLATMATLFIAANINVQEANAAPFQVIGNPNHLFGASCAEIKAAANVLQRETINNNCYTQEVNGKHVQAIDLRPKAVVGGQGTTTPPTTIPNITNTNTNTTTNTATQETNVNIPPSTTTIVNPPGITNTPVVSPTISPTIAPEIKIDNRQRVVNEAPNPLLGILGTQGVGINNFSTIQQLNNNKAPGCEINASGSINYTRDVNGSIGGNRGYIDGGVNYNQWGDQEISASVRVGTTFGGSEGVIVNESVSKNVNCIPFNPAPVNNHFWGGQGYQYQTIPPLPPTPPQQQEIKTYQEEEKDEVKKEECECEGSKENKSGTKTSYERLLDLLNTPQVASNIPLDSSVALEKIGEQKISPLLDEVAFPEF
jgi:hypothetical protein